MAEPTSIGKYRIERELGRGASGVVYRAVDAFKGRQVAIKQLHAHLLRQPEQAERYRKLLRNEVMLTARLRHPNIVRLLGTAVLALFTTLPASADDGAETIQNFKKYFQTYKDAASRVEAVLTLEGLDDALGVQVVCGLLSITHSPDADEVLPNS